MSLLYSDNRFNAKIRLFSDMFVALETFALLMYLQRANFKINDRKADLALISN